MSGLAVGTPARIAFDRELAGFICKPRLTPEALAKWAIAHPDFADQLDAILQTERGNSATVPLIGLEEDCLRDREPERLRSLEIDHQLELGGLLHRQVIRLGALEDLIYVRRGAPEQVLEIHAKARISHWSGVGQKAGQNGLPILLPIWSFDGWM